MFKSTLAAALMTAICLTGASYAQAPDKAAMQAKKEACQTEAKSKNITEKAQRKTFMKECRSR